MSDQSVDERNEHGVVLESGEDFLAWEWDTKDDGFSIEIPTPNKIAIPYEIVDRISVRAAEGVFNEIARTCQLELEVDAAGALVRVRLFDSESEAALSRDLSSMVDEWLGWHSDDDGPKIEPQAAPKALRMIAELERAIARIKAAIPD